MSLTLLSVLVRSVCLDDKVILCVLFVDINIIIIQQTGSFLICQHWSRKQNISLLTGENYSSGSIVYQVFEYPMKVLNIKDLR